MPFFQRKASNVHPGNPSYLLQIHRVPFCRGLHCRISTVCRFSLENVWIARKLTFATKKGFAGRVILCSPFWKYIFFKPVMLCIRSIVRFVCLILTKSPFYPNMKFRIECQISLACNASKFWNRKFFFFFKYKYQQIGSNDICKNYTRRTSVTSGC